MSDFSFDVGEALAAAGAGAGSSDIIGADGSYVPPGPPGGEPFVYGDAQSQLYNTSPQEIASIQSVLAEAGILRSGYTNGRVDEKTIDAYEEVLRISNSEATAPSVVLRNLSATNFARNLGANVARAGDRIAEASSGPTRAPFTARVSNPNDLKRYFREAVKNATGEFRGQVDIDQMVEAYQAIERNAQAASYNAAPSGGTVEAAESPDSFAERTLGEVAPQQVQTRDVVDRAGQLFDMLGNFGGQA